MARIKDVARLARVSPSTVSLVLNHKGYVSEETRARVEAAVAELHYVPSEVARNLSLNRTNIVGVIVPDVAHPFFAQLVREIELSLFRQGFKTMICSTTEKDNGETAFLDMLDRHTMDGLIVGAHALTLSRYERVRRPIVAFDRNIRAKIPILHADHEQGGHLAAEALLRRNPRHVVQITGSASVATTAHRHEDVFADLFREAGILCDRIAMPANAFSPAAYEEAARAVFEQYPDVDAIAASDLAALYALRLAERSGRRVPEDLSIVAYDGTFLTRLGPKTLSAVVQPIEALGRLAAERITALIKGEKIEAAPILPMTFQEGETIS